MSEIEVLRQTVFRLEGAVTAHYTLFTALFMRLREQDLFSKEDLASVIDRSLMSLEMDPDAVGPAMASARRELEELGQMLSSI